MFASIFRLPQVFAIGFCLFCGFFLPQAKAQNSFKFNPSPTYSALSKELIKDITTRLKEEKSLAMEQVPYKDREHVAWLCRERIKIITDQVEAGVFIKNDSLQRYVSNVLARLEASSSATSSRIVLISRSHEVNATCFGRGIFIVTVGLLARVKSEGELAFTIAHEMAHDELDHVQENLIRHARMKLAKKSKEQVTKILSNTLDLEDVEEFRQLVYEASKYSRQKELSADSLGLIIFNRARYSEDDATSMLDLLEASKEPKYDHFGAEMFMPLDADEFPLQPYFFDDQLSIFSKKDVGNIFMLSMDSIRSHPEMEIRKKALGKYLGQSSAYGDGQPAEFVAAVTRTAEFETVESAYRTMYYDWCLFHALQLLQLYPNHPFLVSRVGSVLVKLHEVKGDNSAGMSNYVSRFTAYYSPVGKLVNNMLYNLQTREIGDMAFYFLSNPKNFNKDDESHYYLLWRISEATYRYAVRDEIARDYKMKFKKNISAMKYFEVESVPFSLRPKWTR
jgi:hypothetical protein